MSDQGADTQRLKEMLSNPHISKELFDELKRRLDMLEKR